MNQDDFFGFDAAPLDELGASGDREDDDDFDALNDETFGTAANTGDWEDEHRQLSGLHHENSSGRFFEDCHNESQQDGVRIPQTGGNGISFSGGTLNNGLSSFMRSPPTYNTPPKPSLIDPVKLSESPGNGIWAPEPSMLEKIGFSRGGMSDDADNHLHRLLNQTNATHQQISNVISLHQRQQQQQQQMLSVVPETSVFFGQDMQRLSGANQLPAPQIMSMLNNKQSIQGGFDQSHCAPSLPLGIAGSIKSVADIEMEMRLQQLKNSANTFEGAVRAEDLERTPVSRPVKDPVKPLASLFHDQQQQEHQQQIYQQKQLMEMQRKKTQQQQMMQRQLQQHQGMMHMPQEQPRHTSIHPLTGQPLNAPGVGPPSGHMTPLNRMVPQNLAYMQRQQELYRAGINKRQQQQQQMMGAVRPMGIPPPIQMEHNFMNFAPPTQRTNRNWNDFDPPFADRRNGFANNNTRSRETQFDNRRRDHHFDRDNYGNNGGRVRRDSEAEWEDWERRRMEDEYAGLMTPKQKSWLRNIQTMQLSTDNPYRDDYYYVMFEAKRSQAHPDAPLKIQGLKMLLPVVGGDQDKEAGNTYQPPAMENSLGKLQVASVNAPRKIMDLQVVHLDAKEPTTKLQLEMRTHRMLLLSIEKLYGQLMELEDLDRKVSYLPDSPTRDTFIRHARELANQMWKSISSDAKHMRSLLTVRKGKMLVLTLGRRLGKEAALQAMEVVLSNLPYLTLHSQPQFQNTLYILWPMADELLQTGTQDILLRFAKGLLPYLRSSKTEKESRKEEGSAKNMSNNKDGNEVSPVLESKFSISFMVGVLVQGESAHQKVEMNQHEEWREFVSSVSSVMSSVRDPAIITDTLVRDGGVVNAERPNKQSRCVVATTNTGVASTCTAPTTTTTATASPSVVVLSRGQTLSSLNRQRGYTGAVAGVRSSTTSNNNNSSSSNSTGTRTCDQVMQRLSLSLGGPISGSIYYDYSS
ncbi:Topoisomerase II-associated protein PAT1 [Trinorchestia longiramus]|nr:Topoisomerase II-associated protein PAT1 [Trinorchestia longiramus]